MDRFSRFISMLDEMARVKKEDEFILPDEVLNFLARFKDAPGFQSEEADAVQSSMLGGIKIDPTMAFRWIKGALMKLFVPEVFMADPAPTSVKGTVTTAPKESGKNLTFQFDIPINIEAVKEAFEDKKINVEKVNMNVGTGQMAKTTAQKTVNFFTGASADPPTISAKQWQEGYKTPEQRGEGNQYREGIFMTNNKWYGNIEGRRYRLSASGDQDDPPLEGESSRAAAMQVYEKLKQQHGGAKRMVEPDKGDQTQKVNELISKGVLGLDADDMAFIRYMQSAEATQISGAGEGGETIPASKFLRQALIWRYSPHLVEDPQAHQNGGKTFNLIFPWRGKRWIVKGVPVNAARLRQKFDRLRDEYDLDFYRMKNGLSVGNAMRWLMRAGVKDYRGQSSVDSDLTGLRGSLYHQKKQGTGFLDNDDDLSSAEPFVKAQDAYLNDQADTPATDKDPAIAAGGKFNYDTDWEDIIRQEAIIATNFALRSMSDKVDPDALRNLAQEEREAQSYEGGMGDIANLVYAFLLSKEAVGDGSQYGSQKYRLNKAKSKAMTYISDKLNPQDRDAAIDREQGRQARQDAGPAPASSGEPQTDNTPRGAMITFLRSIRDKHEIDVQDDRLPELADKFIGWISDYRAAEDQNPTMATLSRMALELLNDNSGRVQLHKEPQRLAAERPASGAAVDTSALHARKVKPAAAPVPAEAPPPPPPAPEKKRKKKTPPAPAAAPPPPPPPEEPQTYTQGSLF